MRRLALVAALVACTDDPPAPRYNLPITGAPALKSVGPPPAVDGGALRVIEEQLPEEANRQFKTLARMAASPRWAPFAKLIREHCKKQYARSGAARVREPHDIGVTQYFIRQMPEIYGIDYVAWCGADYVGKLSYAENHLLVVKQGGRYDVLAQHTPTCGSVGDRSVSFVDLLGDGRVELVETYVEDNAIGDDFQEVRVFRPERAGMRLIAEVRVSSPVKFFNVQFRKGEGAVRDIVTTHIEMEKALGTLRTRPCYVYRYYEVETTYRYDPRAARFVPAGVARRRLAPNVALDLAGGEVPEGSCEG